MRTDLLPGLPVRRPRQVGAELPVLRERVERALNAMELCLKPPLDLERISRLLPATAEFPAARPGAYPDDFRTLGLELGSLSLELWALYQHAGHPGVAPEVLADRRDRLERHFRAVLPDVRAWLEGEVGHG